MKVFEYSKLLFSNWEKFVPRTNNGTIFHTQTFLNYHPEGKFNHKHLIFEDRGKWLGVLPGAIIMRDGKRIHASHPGASFGGIALLSDVGVKEAYRMVDLWVEWAKGNKLEGLEFTRVPFIYYEFPEEHVDFAFVKHGGKAVKRELTATLHLEKTDEETFARFIPEARTATRKAEKAGVSVDWEGSIPEFYKILKSNLYARHNVEPTHSLEELLDLQRRFPGKIHQFNAVRNGEAIAGVTIFEVTPRGVIAFYISHDQTAQEFRPLNFLFWEIFKWSISRGFEWFDFGTYTLNMEPNFGLARFKESFGAKGIFRDTLRLIF
jgi:hypothetical protein